jgi:hypothetical protein
MLCWPKWLDDNPILEALGLMLALGGPEDPLADVLALAPFYDEAAAVAAEVAERIGAEAADLVSSSIGEGAAAEGAGAIPSVGQTIYRVYGGDSATGGASWTPVNPGEVANFRDLAGLPSGAASGATNTGQFVITGTLEDPSAVVLSRPALPLDGNVGGLPEYIIPNGIGSGAIRVTGVGGVNPPF